MEFSLSDLNDVLGDIRNLSEGERDFLPNDFPMK